VAFVVFAHDVRADVSQFPEYIGNTSNEKSPTAGALVGSCGVHSMSGR